MGHGLDTDSRERFHLHFGSGLWKIVITGSGAMIFLGFDMVTVSDYTLDTNQPCMSSQFYE